MSDMQIISLIGIVGWLFLAGSALASYRLGWSKMIQMALTWVAIFGAGFVIVSLFV